MAKRILVVDDEEIVIRSVTLLLEKAGYEVYVVKNGRDALAAIEGSSFDLIIADIRMPGINGVETVKQTYKVLDKRKQGRVPVIFITGYADKGIEGQVSKLKPTGYLYKPFDNKELLDKVKEAIDE